MLHFFPLKYSVSPEKVTKMLDNAHHTEAILINFHAKKHINGKTTTYTSLWFSPCKDNTLFSGQGFRIPVGIESNYLMSKSPS